MSALDEMQNLECVAWRYIRWNALIDDLDTVGHRNAAVARALNVIPQTLDGWKKGHEPRYSHGEALLLLHARILGADYTKNRISEFRREALMTASAIKGESRNEPASKENSSPR
jgi:hypothetical protein